MAYELIDDKPAQSARWELVDEEPSRAASTGLRRTALAAIPGFGTTLAALDAMGVTDPISGAKGLVAGTADIGNTILNAMTAANEKAAEYLPDSIVEDRFKKKGQLSSLVTGKPATSEAGRANADREAGLKSFDAENDSPSFSAGRLVSNIAGTSGVGGAGAGLVRTVAPRALAPLATALETAGMRTGLAPTGFTGKVLDMGTRMIGGGATGAASAGLINPDDAVKGGAIGAFLPPVVSGLGAVGQVTAQGVRRMLTPQIARDAKSILEAGNIPASELPAVRAALAQQGPNIVQAPATVPQILQNPGISQLSRTLRNAGDTAGLTAQQAQDAARLEALNRISPVTGTVQQSAENFGNTAGPQIVAGDAAARARTNQAFAAVDPFNDVRVELPLDDMAAQQQRFLGPGTFGMGGQAQAGLDEANRIGLQRIEAVPTARVAPTQDEQTLVQAVRRLGGINTSTPAGQAFAGELHALRQTPGLRGITNNANGQSLDTLAERMHAQGFIPDNDPATLLNHLRDPSLSGGRGAGADLDRIHQAAREALQGDAPGAVTIPQAIPFQQVQDLRSSLSAAARKIENSGGGANKESTALRGMIDDIDARVQSVAQGRGTANESFPPDIVAQWERALQSKRDQIATFRTGPQASLFRQGGDNQAAVQGAELAPKFFSPRLSQSDDMAAFGRVATPESTAGLKNYAVTDAANQTNAAGNLTNAKFNNWLAARSGAVNGLFNEPERATLSAVGRDLSRADNAERLGMATGSNTAQNVQSALSLGLLDNPIVNGIASRTPVIGRFSGPMLDALRQSAKRGKVERMGALLADPDSLERAIAAYQRSATNRPFGLAGSTVLNPLLYRSAPLLANGR